ncbi:MAG: gephyrin-like molybdotransferase Glp, partial [Nocardioidaceae bacterium]
MDAHYATGTGLRSVDDQLRLVLDSLAPLASYDQPLLEATGLPICENVISPIDLPLFSNSAMDGYAVRYADVAHATAERPAYLPVVGEAPAGGSQPYALAPGTSMRIMTGAPLPSGADCVIP